VYIYIDIYIYSYIYIVSILVIFMKTSKLFTLDVELVQKLKNVNGSGLINRLLKEHFEHFNPKHTLLDEKKAILKGIQKKNALFLSKLRYLLRSITLILINFRKYGLKVGIKSLGFSISARIRRVGESKHHSKALKKPGSSTINIPKCSNE